MKFCLLVLTLTVAILAPCVRASPAPSPQEEGVLPPIEEPEPNYAWAPALLYKITQNAAANDLLYDAAFAAGPPIVPQLVAALKDDRTAEFAAQSLAFIGGKAALQALAGLVNDPRDLDLRRFYYGALSEFDTPKANQTLIRVIRNANNEPDRTVTEAAIIALTPRSDRGLAGMLEQMDSRLTDPVIKDDLKNAISIIRSRVRQAAFAPGKAQSIDQAIQGYFRPALAAPGTGSTATSPPAKLAPGARMKLDRVTFAPGKTRALAEATFEDSAAIAHYRIVLQQRGDDWTVASVWLGSEN